MKQENRTFPARDLVRVAAAAALIAVCSLISFPVGPVPVTMQVFGVFFSLRLLGGRRGALAVAVWIALGAAGVPVFSGFTGGIGKLFGATGGYIAGFLLSALLYALITRFAGESLFAVLAAMLAGLAVCYAFGTLWFYLVSLRAGGETTLSYVLAVCVWPFLPFDLVKIALAEAVFRLLPARSKASLR
ncbi:MAG: biotin transporter BioY [Clostridia bacterium]|nr:biotin transporter BioY [Clostridia bacterium]